MADRQREMYGRLPWQNRHPTYVAIMEGRPITSEEGKWLLDEINRLQVIERRAKTYMHCVLAKREAGDDLFTALDPPPPEPLKETLIADDQPVVIR